MRISFAPFWLPKADSTAEEYEDAFWPTAPTCREEVDAFCCAAADGATESSFARLWAHLLVQAYCKHADPGEMIAALPDLQSQWREVVDSQPLPWYAEQKAQSGAFAALLGLKVAEVPDGSEAACQWQAFAVGDVCLFQMRGNVLIRSFPLSSSDQFGYHPYLICSRPQCDETLATLAQTASGECWPGDTLYLMTDALACWFLSRQEQDGSYDDLCDITDQQCFENLVIRERSERDQEGRPHMRNDDVTFIRLVVTS